MSKESEDDKYYREIEEHRQQCEDDFKEQQSEERWYSNKLEEES